MADLSFIVGIVGNVISILVFTSPVGTFRRVVKKKSTEDFKAVPYITTLLSTSLWTFYGLLKPGGLLVATVNGIGSVSQTIFVTLFLIYAPKESRVKTAKMVAILNVGFVGVVILVTLLAIHGNIRLVVIGFLCAGLTVGMYAAPLASMRTVIKTKSVEYMSFSLSFFLFLNAGVWAAYSVLVGDYYIGVPNGIGFVLGSAQLVLYGVYRRKTQLSSKGAEVDEEEGSAQLVRRVEMQEYHDGENGVMSGMVLQPPAQQRYLNKGSSLPKPSVSSQQSLTKIVKSISASPYELYSSYNWQNPKQDAED